MRTKKIFVGGLSATTSLEDIRAYFEQFSKVKEAMLAYDKVTSRHRGFGFVTFDNEDVVDKICEIHFHEINGIIRFIVVNYELFYREDCKFSIYFYNFLFQKVKWLRARRRYRKNLDCLFIAAILLNTMEVKEGNCHLLEQEITMDQTHIKECTWMEIVITSNNTTLLRFLLLLKCQINYLSLFIFFIILYF